MRKFHGLLFLGSGKWSVLEAERLRERLNEAVSLLGGLQQSSQGYPEDWAEIAKGKEELRDVARDIAVALTGQAVVFGAVLPYPPRDTETGELVPALYPDEEPDAPERLPVPDVPEGVYFPGLVSRSKVRGHGGPGPSPRRRDEGPCG